MWIWIFAGFTLLQLVEGGTTIRDHYLITGGRTGYLQHPGMWSDFIILNALAAYIVNAYGSDWNGKILIGVLIVAGVVCVGLLYQWTQDSLKVPESLARNGMLPIAGAMHYLRMVVYITIIVMYYCFTKDVGAQPWVLAIITSVIVIHVAIGVLLPPYVTMGMIPASAYGITAAAFAILVTLFLLAYTRVLPFGD